MDNKDFLDLGIRVNNLMRHEASESDVNFALQELAHFPQDADKDYLEEALSLRTLKKGHWYTHREKQDLLSLALMWNRFDAAGKPDEAEKGRYEFYAFLADEVTLDRARYNPKRQKEFYALLQKYCGSNDERKLIFALLRVQEATIQFLNYNNSSRPRPAKDFEKVLPDLYMITCWK